MQFPEARLVVGGTEVTIESRISKGAPPRAYLSAASIAEQRVTAITPALAAA